MSSRDTTARRTAHTALADVDSILSDVEDRADRLLTELLALIDDDTDHSTDDASDDRC